MNLKLHHVGYYLGVSKSTEILFLTFIGICHTIIDALVLDFKSDLTQVWNLKFDSLTIAPDMQAYIRYVLTGVILVRTFLTHLHLAFYIIMTWPLFFEDRPRLLLPWMTVAFIKCIATGLATFGTGLFACYKYGIYRASCADFCLAQIVDNAPGFYLWFCVVSYYRELKMLLALLASEQIQEDKEDSEITMRRRKVRSLIDEVASPKHHCTIDEDRHLISVSTIENIVQQLTTDLHRKTTRSLDSLLGVMAAEAEKEELMSLCDEPPSEEAGLTVQEKTTRLLKITDKDISEARTKRKLDQGLLFTVSMLDITSSACTSLKATSLVKPEKTYSLQNDKLRLTKSERARSFIENKSKVDTEFMSSISETEIKSVLNYSTTSLQGHTSSLITTNSKTGEYSDATGMSSIDLDADIKVSNRYMDEPRTDTESDYEDSQAVADTRMSIEDLLPDTDTSSVKYADVEDSLTNIELPPTHLVPPRTIQVSRVTIKAPFAKPDQLISSRLTFHASCQGVQKADSACQTVIIKNEKKGTLGKRYTKRRSPVLIFKTKEKSKENTKGKKGKKGGTVVKTVGSQCDWNIADVRPDVTTFRRDGYTVAYMARATRLEKD